MESRHQPWHEPQCIEPPDRVARFEERIDRIIAYGALAMVSAFLVDDNIQHRQHDRLLPAMQEAAVSLRNEENTVMATNNSLEVQMAVEEVSRNFVKCVQEKFYPETNCDNAPDALACIEKVAPKYLVGGPTNFVKCAPTLEEEFIAIQTRGVAQDETVSVSQ